LGPGDCISIPLEVFRGFENVGDDVAYLFAVLGGNDPGHVTWAPDVFDKARDYGLVLLDNGSLVDTTKGEIIPAGSEAQQPTSPQQVAAHRRMTAAEMSECVCTDSEQRADRDSRLTEGVVGVCESPLIGGANTSEGIETGKLAWRHGFHVRRLDLEQHATLPQHSRKEEEVVYVRTGSLDFTWKGGVLHLEPGDVLTVPVGLVHGFGNPQALPTVAYIVRGGDKPAPPQWA